MSNHDHKEAFCLMQYRSKDGTESEQIWNSRDGVTPFGVLSRNGKQMYHVEWNNDEYDPYFVPPSGMRIFVNATRELVTQALTKYVEKIFTEHGGGYWRTREEAFEALLPDWLKDGTAPWLVVTE
jgi:hypothetical protein